MQPGLVYTVNDASREQVMGELHLFARTELADASYWISLTLGDGSSITGRLVDAAAGVISLTATEGQQEVPFDRVTSLTLRRAAEE